MAVTEDMEATVTITARDLLMPSLLLSLRLTPNLDTEAMVAMEATVDTEVMEAMVDTGEDTATTTERGPLMLRLDMEATVATDMEAMVDTATTTERGLLMLRLDMEATVDTDMEAMVATA